MKVPSPSGRRGGSSSATPTLPEQPHRLARIRHLERARGRHRICDEPDEHERRRSHARLGSRRRPHRVPSHLDGRPARYLHHAGRRRQRPAPDDPHPLGRRPVVCPRRLGDRLRERPAAARTASRSTCCRPPGAPADRLTTSAGADGEPIWLPAVAAYGSLGGKVVFTSLRFSAGGPGIFAMTTAGASTTRLAGSQALDINPGQPAMRREGAAIAETGRET